MARKIKRIMNELKELEESKEILIQSGIYFHYDEENIEKINVMFIGPINTPYEKGFYFFDLTYPEEYPMTPPIMKYCTQGFLTLNNNSNINKTNNLVKVRFNPNLYTNGKVCISMLNTWKGPGWVPTNTASNIFVAIQALVFNEEPLRNEPGFENSSQTIIDTYTKIIEYSNIKTSIIEQFNKDLGQFEMFRNIIKSYIKENISIYDTNIENIIKNKNEIVNSPAYGMNVLLDYKLLKDEYEKFKDIIMN
jgi:ubiquitin-protein ligase